MYYFFERGTELLQCEFRGDDAAGYEIVIFEKKRPKRLEAFPSSQEACERWMQLQASLDSDGWCGPHGRD